MVECPRCGSDNVASSNRRGVEKILQYVYPRVPYRCKECWSRFWKFENPIKSKSLKFIVAAVVVLAIIVIGVVIWINQETDDRISKKLITKRSEKESSGMSQRLPMPKTREIVRKEDTDRDAQTLSTIKKTPVVADTQSPTGSVSDVTPEAETVPSQVPDHKAVAEKPMTPVVRPDDRVQPDMETQEKMTPPALPKPKPVSTPKSTSAETTEPEKPTVRVAAVAPTPTPAPKIQKEHSPKPKPVTDQNRVTHTLRQLVPKSIPDGFSLNVIAKGSVSRHVVSFFDYDLPHKVVLDLPGKWNKPKNLDKMVVDSAIVNQVRIGEHPDKIRIVLDLKIKGPVSQTVRETAEGCELIIKKRKS